MAANVQLGRLPGRVIAALYLCLFPLVGLIVAHIGFCDPDTCWHLAMGKWMCVHNQLPLSDPFSTNISEFVLTAKGQPIMQHEWLSDCIFYRIYGWGGAKLLLAFVAALSALALIIAPSLLMVKCGSARLVALLATVFGLPACMFRLWVRPEIFSFTYFAALIWLVEIGRRSSKRTFLFCLFGTFTLLAFWANCHALFVLGLFYLGLYTTLTLLQQIVSRSQSLPTGAEGSGASLGKLAGLTVAGILGSLCTPWQGSLWLYVLKIVLSPQSHGNKENGPLDLNSMGHITVIPLVMSFIFIAFFFVKLKMRRGRVDSEVTKSLSPGKIVVAYGLYASSLAIAVFFRRLTPFALLILFNSAAVLFEQARSIAQTSKFKSPDNDDKDSAIAQESPANWMDASQQFLGQLKLPGLQTSILGIFLAMETAWTAATYLVPPEIPSASRFFTPACQALVYLGKIRPGGRMLNDSKFGSMIPFYMEHPPDLFIDGRFDSYSRQLIDDYQQMRLAKPGYQELLRHYKIDWVFFPPDTPLVQRLLQDPAWNGYYQDGAAVVIERAAK